MKKQTDLNFMRKEGKGWNVSGRCFSLDSSGGTPWDKDLSVGNILGEILPDNSADKESACNAGDLGFIPGSGQSPGDWIGYPLQYSWASLCGSDDKENSPIVLEIWV